MNRAAENCSLRRPILDDLRLVSACVAAWSLISYADAFRPQLRGLISALLPHASYVRSHSRKVIVQPIQLGYHKLLPRPNQGWGNTEKGVGICRVNV